MANGLVRELFKPLSPLANRFGLAWGVTFLLLWLDYFNFRLLPEWLLLFILFCVTLASFRWRKLLSSCDTLVDRAACMLCILPTWFFSVTVTRWAGWVSFSATLGQLGLGLVFLLGLGWCVWLVDRASKMLLAKRQLTSHLGGSTDGPLISMNNSLGQATTQTSNPLDVEAWFYGSKRRKLNQSATAMGVYIILFTLLLLLITQLTGCNEIYEMPDGGGEPQRKQQVVKIQKVIRKKIILNPLSAVLFNPPPIEKIKLQIEGLKKISTVWEAQNQPDKSIRIYDRLAKLAPDQLAEWRESVAEIYSSTGQHDEAIEVYKELITIAPSNSSTWHWTIGSIYEETDRLKLAIQVYRRSDNYPKAYFQMAKCYRKLKEHTEALTLYHQALATESAAPDAALAIGYTYEEQANKKNAIKWFQRTCKLYPRSRNASKAHSHLQKEYGISVTLGGSKEK